MQRQRLIQHTGFAELTIEGKNLKDTLRLLHDGVEYTPLATTDNSVTFILGDNGTNRIYVNGKYSFAVKIEGVVVPGELPLPLAMLQTPQTGASTGSINERSVRSNCINYNYTASDSFPFFLLFVGDQKFPFTNIEEFEFFNCSAEPKLSGTGARVYMYASIIDNSKPSYITYKGFIIAVFNYE